MISQNPIIGTALHAVGGISASTCYLPFQKTKRWSWESYWIIQASFAWLIMPLVIGLLTVPHLFSVLRSAPVSAITIALVLGAVYGFGGLSFGYAIRHIGYSLTYTISIGISAVLGTITPLILNGTLIKKFQEPGGLILLLGISLSVLGVIICGIAGYRKEKDINQGNNQGGSGYFNIRKGLILTLIAGVLSAVFGISLEYGQPISDIAAQKGAGYFQGNAKIIISTAGCYVTNFTWFIILGIKQGTLKEIIQVKEIGAKTITMNFFWAILSGSLWYFQFFFYGLGHVKMGNFGFASWVIHMSMLVFFSYLVGLIMKEWKMVSRRTYNTLLIALAILVVSFFIIGFGTTNF